MGLSTTSRRFVILIIFLLIPSVVHSAAIKGLEEGTQVGYCSQIDYIGGALTLTTSGLKCTLTSTAGAGGGDVSDVGDCSGSACFTANGTGSTLHFEGATANTFETIIGTIDPTADRTFNFPDDEMVAGDVLVSSDTSDLEYLNLATTQILIGDGAGIPTAAALSGDATMTNGGVVTVVDDLHNHVIGNIDSMTSAALAGQISNETGTGVAVFGTAPTIATPVLTGKIDRNNVAVDDDDCTGEQGLYWYDTTDSAFEFCNANSGAPTTLSGGSDTNAIYTICWSGPETKPLTPVSMPSVGTVDGFAPPGEDTGTNSEIEFIAFDDTADEYRKVRFMVPTDVAASSNITFRLMGYAATAAAQDVAIVLGHHEVGDAEVWDGALTEETMTTTLTNTQDTIDFFSKSDESATDLGWAANDVVDLYIGRDGDHATDDGLTGDFRVTEFCMDIPRA